MASVPLFYMALNKTVLLVQLIIETDGIRFPVSNSNSQLHNLQHNSVDPHTNYVIAIHYVFSIKRH